MEVFPLKTLSRWLKLLLLLALVIGLMVSIGSGANLRGSYLRWDEVSGKPFVDVRDFGAKGDGVSDDSDAFQKAIDTAGNNGEVIIPKTSTAYKITKKLNLKEYSNVRGIGNPIINFYGDDTNYCLFSMKNWTLVSSMIINVKKSGTAAIDSPDGMSYTSIERVRINGTGEKNNQYGIRIRGTKKDDGTANANSFDNSIIRCRFTSLNISVYLDGADIYGARCNANKVEKCMFTDFSTAIYSWGHGNIIRDNNFDTPKVKGAKYLVIRSNLEKNAIVDGNYFDSMSTVPDSIEIAKEVPVNGPKFGVNMIDYTKILNMSSAYKVQ